MWITIAVGDKGCPPVKLVITIENFAVAMLELLMEELVIVLDATLELDGMGDSLAFFLPSPPQPVKTRAVSNVDKITEIFFMIFPLIAQ